MNTRLLRSLIADAQTRSRTLPGVAVDEAPDAPAASAAEAASVVDGTAYVRRLRAGHIADLDFDAIFPLQTRALSSTFWTPVRAATRAAELLVRDASTRVLDIGSGAGKFCIVGAATPAAHFVGIEHRAHPVETARAAAARVGVTNTEFVHGTFDTMDASPFDAFYLFNPFEENVWDSRTRIDDTVELSQERLLADIERTESLLANARVGTRVVTYHGFGGCMPPGYRLELREYCLSGNLDLWVRRDAPGIRARHGASELTSDAPADGGAYVAYLAPHHPRALVAPRERPFVLRSPASLRVRTGSIQPIEPHSA